MYPYNQTTYQAFNTIVPQSITQSVPIQSYTPQTSQVILVPQTLTTQSVVPQVPQYQSVVPAVQTIAPVQNIATVPIAPQPLFVPYVMPKGSRLPISANHMGQLPNGSLDFNNIGGCPYGRISMIK